MSDDVKELPPPSRFAGDDGSADPAFAALLGDFSAGRAPLRDVVAALAGVRILVPVLDGAAVRVLGDDHDHTTGVVAVAAPDGRRAMPIFSSLDAMRAWRPEARPLPNETIRAALVAVNQGWGLLVLDPAGPVAVTVPRPAMWALARGIEWEPAVSNGVVDPRVVAEVRLAAEPVRFVRSASAEPGTTAEVAVVLAIDAGLDRAALDAVLRQVNARLGASSVIADRVDSLELRIRAAR
jgi:hypothetical protein